MMQKAKITRVEKNSIFVKLHSGIDTEYKVALFTQYGLFNRPSIGDVVYIFANNNKSSTSSYIALYGKPTENPDLPSDGDFATGNFLTKSFLKFFSKKIETSDEVDNVKIAPKTELSLAVGSNTLKIDANGFDVQTQNVKIGAGTFFILDSSCQIIAPAGGGNCQITPPTHATQFKIG